MLLNKKVFFTLAISLLVLSSFIISHKGEKPVLFIIGDSTVKNGDGTGKNNQMGWGTMIDMYFDTVKISVSNHAIGGRSSRTFITEGRWDKILSVLKKGDYVLMQFGHNDAGPLADTARARGTIRGVGTDSMEIYNPIRKMQETVYSYGYYMRKYARDTKAKGAIPVICSPIPRYSIKNGRVDRSDYAEWARQVAAETGAYFIPLNDMIATEYEKMDTAQVRSFFPADHTHTNTAGAVLNAQIVVKGIKGLDQCQLKKYLIKP